MKTLLSLFMLSSLAVSADRTLVFVGTYSDAIHAYALDTKTGTLEPLGPAAPIKNASFLELHPNGKFLYAVSESAGGVSAFAIEAGGKLKPLNTAKSAGGGPCYITVDKTGSCALIANYGGGSVAAFPIAPDGTVKETSAFIQHKGSGANPRRQREPHAHSINLSPDNRFAIAADLGTDQLFVYRFDASKGSLEPNDPPFTKVEPGSGPRHFAFHPGGKFAYVINELTSKVTALAWDAKRGALDPIEYSTTLPEGFTGENSTAEVRVHPNGKFLYGSNRGHDSIAVFAIDPKKGTLKPVEHVSTQGRVPRNFNIDPSGKFLIAANQNSDTLVVFRIDPKSGKLTPAGQPVAAPKPVCVRFLASR